MAASTVPASPPKPQSAVHIESFCRHLASDMARFAMSFNRPLETLTRAEITGYLAKDLCSQPRATARKLSTIQHFYSFLLNEQIIRIDPARGISVLPTRCTFKLANPKKRCKAQAAEGSRYCAPHKAVAAIFAPHQEMK